MGSRLPIQKSFDRGFFLLAEHFLDEEKDDYQLSAHRFDTLTISRKDSKSKKAEITCDGDYWTFGVICGESKDKTINLIIPENRPKDFAMPLTLINLPNGSTFYLLNSAVQIERLSIEIEEENKSVSFGFYSCHEKARLAHGIESFIYRAGVPFQVHDKIYDRVLATLGVDTGSISDNYSRIDTSEAFNIIFSEEMRLNPGTLDVRVNQRRKFDRIIGKD